MRIFCFLSEVKREKGRYISIYCFGSLYRNLLITKMLIGQTLYKLKSRLHQVFEALTFNRKTTQGFLAWDSAAGS